MWRCVFGSFFMMSAVIAAPLEPAGTIAMPDVKGRIDHMSVDVAGKRLFVAALGNGTVEVFDVGANRHLRSLRGFGEPQGVLYVPASHRLFVANGTEDRVDILDGESLEPLARVNRLPDGDNVRLSPDGRVVVGYGEGALRFLDPSTGQSAGEVRLAGHPEAFQFERSAAHAYVNVPRAGHVAVVDREKAKVVAVWKLGGARANFPMTLDEEGARLFVGARSPAAMLVFDTRSGEALARLPICGDTDDLFFDAERKRVYVVCGEGKVEVFSHDLSREATVDTARGARTGLFVPEYARLYVAAPASGGAAARLLVFQARRP